MRCVCGRGVKLCLKFGYTYNACGRSCAACVRTHMERRGDGQHAVAHERVDAQRIDACPLHDASERGQVDVRVHAGRVQIEALSPVKLYLSHPTTLARSTCHGHGSSAASDAAARLGLSVVTQ